MPPRQTRLRNPRSRRLRARATGQPGSHQASTSHRRRRTLHPAVLFAPALAVSAVLAVPAVLGQHPTASSVEGDAVQVAGAPVTSGPDTISHGRADLPLRANRSTRRQPIKGAGSAHHKAAAHHAARPQWVRPDVGPLTSGYGYRPSMGDFHPGIDLAGPYGSPIRAASAGRIVFAGPAAGFGQMIRIAHPGGIVTVYGHMSRILRWHGHVRAGQVIALEGSEGHSTGPHLHFEVYVHGQRVDPLGFLRRHGVTI